MSKPSDVLKTAIRESGQSLNAISLSAKVPSSTLSRFLTSDKKKHRDIRLEATADDLCEYFDLVLVPRSHVMKSKRPE